MKPFSRCAGPCLLLALALAAGAARAADVFWTNNGGSGDGNWGTGTNWSSGSVPGSSDRAVFSDNAMDAGASIGDCAVDVDADVGGVLIKSGYTGTVAMDATRTFTVHAQHFEMNAGAFVGDDGAITIGTTFLEAADLRILGGSFTSTSGTLTLKHNFIVSGTGSFDHAGGTISVTASNDPTHLWTFDSDTAVNDLEANMGSHVFDHNLCTGHLIVDGTLTISGVGIWNDGTVHLRGDVTGTDQFVYGSATFIIDGTGDQQVGNTNTGEFLGLGGNHTVNKASGMLTYLNGISISRNFTVSSAAGGVTTAGTTFEFKPTGSVGTDITLNHATTGFEFENLIIAKISFSAHFMDDAIVNGDLDIQSVYQIGASATPPGPTIQVYGNLSIAEDLVVNAVTLELKGSADQSVTVQTATPSPGDLPDGDLIVNKTGGLAFLTAGLAPASAVGTPSLIVREGAFACNGFDVAMDGAITVEDGGNLKLAGNESISPAPTLDSGSTVTYVGDGDSSADTYTLKNWTYRNIAIAAVDASDTFEMGANLSVSEDLALSGGILDATGNDYDVNIQGDWSQSGSGTFVPQGGDVEFQNAGAASTIGGATTFYDFTCVAAGKTLNFAAGAKQTVGGTLTLAGASGNPITLRSTVDGTRWRMRTKYDAFARDVSYVDVKDAINTGLPMIFTNPPNDPANSTDSGNNVNWFSDVTAVQASASAVTADVDGNSWTLTSSAVDGFPPYSYHWTGPAGAIFDDADAQNTSVDITGSTGDTELTVTATVTDNLGFTDSVDLTVFRSSTGLTATVAGVYVTPPSTDPFSPDIVVVAGSDNAFKLTATPTNFTAVSAEWYDVTGTPAFLSTDNPVTLDPPATSGTYTYQYRGKDSHGLTGFGSIDVYVVDPVSPNPKADPVVLDPLVNVTTALDAEDADGGAPDAGFGAYTYEWRDLDTDTVIGTGTSVLYSPTGVGTHTVQITATDELGNEGVDTIEIPLIESALTVVATGTEVFGGTKVTGNDLVGFAGGSLNLGSEALGGSGGYAFSWTGPAAFSSTSPNPGEVILPLAVGTFDYTVFLTDTLYGNTVSDMVTVQVFDSIAMQDLAVGNGKLKYKASTASTLEKPKDMAKVWVEGLALDPGDRLAFDFNGLALGDVADGDSILLDEKSKGEGTFGPPGGPNRFAKVKVSYSAKHTRLQATCSKGDFDPFSQGAPMASAVTGLSTVVNVTVFVDRAPADNVVDETIVLPLMFKVRAKLSPSGVFTESGKKIAP